MDMLPPVVGDQFPAAEGTGPVIEGGGLQTGDEDDVGMRPVDGIDTGQVFPDPDLEYGPAGPGEGEEMRERRQPVAHGDPIVIGQDDDIDVTLPGQFDQLIEGMGAAAEFRGMDMNHAGKRDPGSRLPRKAITQ